MVMARKKIMMAAMAIMKTETLWLLMLQPASYCTRVSIIPVVDEDGQGGDDSDHTHDGEMVKKQPNLKVSARKEEDARFSARLDDHLKVKRDSNC